MEITMKKRHKKIIYWLIAIAAAGGLTWVFAFYSNQPGPLDAFAQCLEEEGTTFYGAYWCPACNQQKTMFGRSAQHLPYEECSLPNNGGQTQECADAEIQSYPTWEFSDGERVIGVMSPQELSQRTNCELPS